jgi:hypothetical protein
MGKINWARVILGGLLAGVVINILEYVTNGVVLKNDWEAAMKALGREMPAHAIPIFIVGSFLAGIGVVALYALARPRCGPGVKTAASCGFFYWVFAYALCNVGFGAMGFVPLRMLVIGTLVGLVELILASIAGAAVYKEQA